MKKLFSVGVFCALLAFFSVSSHAVTVGPVYPAPGGNVWNGSGNGTSGTATWDYSNFNTSGLDALYFGLNQVDYGPAGAGLDGSLTAFTFSGISGQTATWEATTTWYNSVNLNPTAANTRLLMTVTGLGATPWTTDLTSVGLDDTGTFGVLGAVVDNSAGLDFTLLWSIEADTGSGWQSIQSVLQHNTHDGDSVSSIATGFYSVATVPVPAAVWLFGSAIGLLGWMRRKTL